MTDAEPDAMSKALEALTRSTRISAAVLARDTTRHFPPMPTPRIQMTELLDRSANPASGLAGLASNLSDWLPKTPFDASQFVSHLAPMGLKDVVASFTQPTFAQVNAQAGVLAQNLGAASILNQATMDGIAQQVLATQPIFTTFGSVLSPNSFNDSLSASKILSRYHQSIGIPTTSSEVETLQSATDFYAGTVATDAYQAFARHPTADRQVVIDRFIHTPAFREGGRAIIQLGERLNAYHPRSLERIQSACEALESDYMSSTQCANALVELVLHLFDATSPEEDLERWVRQQENPQGFLHQGNLTHRARVFYTVRQSDPVTQDAAKYFDEPFMNELSRLRSPIETHKHDRDPSRNAKGQVRALFRKVVAMLELVFPGQADG